jgi:signal peptidase I
MGKIKDALLKFWHFLWDEDSWLSWIVNIILAFVIIKWIVYPLLGFLLGTSFPIVAVVSGSMEHSGSFDSWWSTVCTTELIEGDKILQKDIYAKEGITYERFLGFPLTGGFNKGDLMILFSPKEISIGDVIVFNAPDRSDPIIHRVVEIGETESGKVFKTKGDHNCASAPFEQATPHAKVYGKAVVRIPWLGWVKVGAVALWSAITQ